MLLCRKPWSHRKRSAYSRVDMVLLMLIGGTVLSLLIIALSRVRRQHDGMPHDASNLKSIALAYHSFNDDFKRLPPAFDSFEPMKFKFPASVHVHLLPFLEWEPFHRIFHGNPEFFKPNRPPIMHYYVSNSDPSCQSDQDLMGIQNFAANLRVLSRKGWNTKFDAEMPALARIEPGNASFLEGFEDGLSNTILLATKFACCSEGGSHYLASPDSRFGAFFGQSPASQRAQSIRTRRDISANSPAEQLPTQPTHRSKFHGARAARRPC